MSNNSRIRVIHVVICLTFLLPGFAVSVAAQKGNLQRGQSLYENHCTECHTSVVHVREDHKAKSIDEIEQFILRWVNYRKLPWTMEEVNDVLAYVNGRYYQYQEKVQ